MKIGFNVKKIINAFEETIYNLSSIVIQNENNIANHETRITTLENSSGSDWVEITSSNGQEAEITRPFKEIRMLARCSGGINYTVTVPYDENIFNLVGPSYFMCGNPTANNYGCKFKHMIANNKQYVCVDSCFNGGNQDASEFRAWIKVDNTPQ